MSASAVRRSGATPDLTSRYLCRHCKLDRPSRDLLTKAIERLGLSARAYDRIPEVSRTIANLAGSDALQPAHVAEAVQYRAPDRACFGK